MKNRGLDSRLRGNDGIRYVLFEFDLSVHPKQTFGFQTASLLSISARHSIGKLTELAMKHKRCAS